MYWDGVYNYLGMIVVFLGFVALARIDKFGETLLLISFPLLQAVLYGLFVIIDNFQPRFIVCSSVFYFILVASSFEMIYLYTLTTLTNRVSINLQSKSREIIRIINTGRLMKIFIFAFLIILFFNFTYPIYDKHKKVMESWNLPVKYDWLDVFKWIINNTSPQDIIAARYSYFAWYIDRPTVTLSSFYHNLNITNLIEIIRDFKVKYLVVDQTFALQHRDLSLLYLSPHPFMGAKIVYDNIGHTGYRTIIYDVTKIAYGRLESTIITIDRGESLEYYQPFTYYGNGSLSLDSEDRVEGNYSVKVIFTTNNLHDSSVAITFTPQEKLDLSTFTYITIPMKIPEGKYIEVKLATDVENYFTARYDKLVFGDWFNVTIPIQSFKPTLGNPNIERINFIQIYVKGLEANTTYQIHIDGIMLHREVFVDSSPDSMP
jgi:hypothetical protein